jgi:protein-tyrosine phosphatase
MSPMAFVLTPAPEVAEMLEPQPLPPHALPPAIAHPHNMPPALTPESPNIDNPAEALRRYEWAEEQRKQVTEFARLCSQWPQSSYNLAKWGPNGCPHVQYIPQSWANPRHVVRTMQRQAELERVMCTEDTTFFAAAPRSTRSSSTDEDSEPSLYSFVSSHSSVATTVSRGSDKGSREERLCAAVWAATSTTVGNPLSTEEAFKATEQKTAADLHAAMSSPMVDAWRGEESIVSVSSAVSVASVVSEESKTTSAWASMACSTKSLSELDRMADLATTDKMDVDEPEVLASIPHVGGSHPSPPRSPNMRPSSCPAKRPLTMIADDEDKRRKVDDMVVDDSTPVFSEEPAALPPSMSASVPNLRMVSATVSGHVIKTSETHPIIISPFIPTEIMSTLGKYLVTIPTDANKPLVLNSDIDVPSLLLSCAPPNQCPSEAGLVGTTMFSSGQKTLIKNLYRPSNGSRQSTRLGNLLLSSCPGKRLRMDGPVKGRGPVCRDLRADMRRIKGEGVGAIVCCLDDEELALLGVPWDYYREVASDIGLDIIRLPMPDGFTPVSLQLFDAQVSLITQRYTLQGINVLVHCRGGIGRAGLTACAWAIKMGFVQPHPSLASTVSKPETASPCSKKKSKSRPSPVVPANEDERQIVMSIVERVIAMIRSRRGLKAIESMEQVQFLSTYVTWLRECTA